MKSYLYKGIGMIICIMTFIWVSLDFEKNFDIYLFLIIQFVLTISGVFFIILGHIEIDHQKDRFKKKNKKNKAYVKALQLEIDRLTSLNEQLKKKMDVSYFLPLVLSLTADLIHHQAEDSKETYPDNSKYYGIIGKLLKHLAKPHRVKFTVSELLQDGSSIEHIIDSNILDKLKDFDAVKLIDLASKMQEKKEDKVFDEIAEFVSQF